MGQSLTKNQQIILQTFQSFPIHPTAEQLFDLVRQNHPKIGLSTLYRILGQLVKLGKIQKISGLETKDHYDHTLTSHPHFICKKCGEVFDIPNEMCIVSVDAVEQQMGVCCRSIQLNIRGVCSKCNQKKE